MSRTSDFSKDHPYAVARGWVSSGFAANALDSVSDGTTEVDDVRALLISGGKVNDLDNGLAEITFGGLSVSSNSGLGAGGALPVYMLNNSAFDLIPGDVVITDDTKDSAVTTTSTASNTHIVGIVQAPIPKLQYGPVLFNGLAPIATTTGVISRGNYALTSTTAKAAAATAARVAGSFGVYLTGTDASDFVTAAANTETGSTVTSLSLNMPLNIPAGRVLFLGLWLESTTSDISISGWTRIGSTAGYYYFYKISEGDDTATATWTGGSVAVGSVLLLHPNVSLASPIASSAYDSTTSAASVSGLSDAPRYAIAGVAANVVTPGSSFVRLAGGSATLAGAGSPPAIVQAKAGVTTDPTITLDSAVTVGNVLCMVLVGRGTSIPNMGGELGWTLLGSAPASVDYANNSDKGYVAVYGIVATTSSATHNKDNFALGRLYEISNANLSNITVLSTSNYNPSGTTATLNLGTYTTATGVAVMGATETRGTDQANHSVAIAMSASWNERADQSIDSSGQGNPWAGIGDVTLSAATQAASWDFTESAPGQTIGELAGVAVLFSTGTVHAAAGTLAGKYIGHVSSVTSPFTGASQQNDAIFAINLLADAKPAVLLYGPDLGAGGASISVGSNSTDVAGITAMGATGAYADAAHWHKGVFAVTSSSSNTLQRPIVNLRPGSGVAFGLTDSDANGDFDTLTISSTASGGGGSSSNYVMLADSLLGSDTASFDFTSISGAYKHLRLIVQARSDRTSATGDFVAMRFNNDSGANYDYQWNQFFAGSTSPTEGLGATSFAATGLITAVDAPANRAGQVIIDIANYVGTTWDKNYTAQFSAALGTGTQGMRDGTSAGNWRDTSAITRITLFPLNGSNFKTGSRVTMYGLS